MINYSYEELSTMNVLSDQYMSELLHELRARNYFNQSNMQRDNVIIERRTLKVSDFVRRVKNKLTGRAMTYKYTAYMDFEFINPQRKLTLKRSNLIGEDMSFYEISKRPDVFDKNFMCFIEGLLVDVVSLNVDEGRTEFILNVDPGKPSGGVPFKTYSRWREEDISVDFLFFTNTKFSPIETDRRTLLQHKTFMDYKDPLFTSSLNDEDRYAMFILSQDGFQSNLLDVMNKENLLKYYSGLASVSEVERSHLNIYGFKNLHSLLTIPAGEKVFQIPGFKMPVPIENIIPFIKTADGNRYDGTLSIKNHFPNFYEFEGDQYLESDINLLIFYSKENTHFKPFYNAVESYYRIMGDSLETFKDSPFDIKNYNPESVDFSIRDYLNSQSENSLMYKLEVLDRLVNSDPEYLRKFLKERIESSSGFYIRISTIDLTTRKRRNSEQELDYEDQIPRYFREDRYVFKMKDLFLNDKYDVRFYIDGELYVPDALDTYGAYSNLYIPVTLIKPNSMIEVEQIARNKVLRTTYDYDGNDNFISIPVGIYNRTDIGVYSNNVLVPEDAYDLTVTDGSTVPVDDFRPIMYNSINVSFKDLTYINTKVDVILTQECEGFRFKYSGDKSAMEKVVNVKMDGGFKAERVRVFKNGRFLPNYHVTHSSSPTDLTNVNLTVHVAMRKDDSFYVDILPHDYVKILDVSKVPNNGVLDLRGFIDRPFDLNWHDVYVNGKRMTKDNFEFISPLLIKLKDVKSMYNLWIYEKRRSKDVISLKKGNVIDTIWKEDPRFQQKLVGLDTNVTNEETDILSDSVYWYIDELRKFFVTEMASSLEPYHINPDVYSITPEIKDKYPRLFREYSNVLQLNADVGDIGFNDYVILYINPDSTNDGIPMARGLFSALLEMEERRMG